MAKPQVSLPIIDMLTGDEVTEAIVRFVLARKGVADPETCLKRATHQVSYRNVRLPDGSVSRFATVGLFLAAKEEVRQASDTPIPEVKDNG